MKFAYCTQYANSDTIKEKERDNMGKTSSAVKDRYNAKAYEEIKVRVFKGQKDKIKAHADSMGESVNSFIGRAIENQIERDTQKRD